ncbi:MAG: prepilin-type N-terminal cleavage/methylation domain-containing protein [Planctomycetota bacterium]
MIPGLDPSPPAARHAAARGFTLIELLVVIGLLAMLAVVLLPSITGAREQGNIVESRARMQHLAQAVEGFQRLKNRGYYPPDNFQCPAAPEVKAKGAEGETNAGIESALIYLHQRAEGLQVFDDKEDWLANTDGDSNGVEIPLLHRSAKVEVLDAWGTPLVYFTSQGYGKTQRVKLESGDTLDVTAWKNPNSNSYLAPRTFQIISAGPDRKFNTEDDLTYPER